MLDLSETVQGIASKFYETRSEASFTKFYTTLLPEANKMLRPFIKDSQQIEDISSRIFEMILTKPSIFYDLQMQEEFKSIADRFFGTSCKHRILVAQPTEGSTAGKHVKSFFEPECHKATDGIPAILGFSEVGKIWLILNRPDTYTIRIDDQLITVSEFVGFKKALHTINLTKLKACPSPFIFNPDKPFLHYFSKIIKTNALSFLKKNKNTAEQYFTDMYSGFDDDDRPQLIANQLSDESDKIDAANAEEKRLMNEQKFMIIHDIISQTVPKNQQGIMVDAILLDMDYAKIAQKHGLVKIKIDGIGTKSVTNIDDHGKITTDHDGDCETLIVQNMGDLKMRMDSKMRVVAIDKGGNIHKCRLIDGTGCLKSRVHRFKKRLDQELATVPQFTTQCNIGVYTAHYTGNRVRMQVDIIETEVDGIIQTIYHGPFVHYYSTGEIKEMGRYFLNKRQGDWYSFYKNGSIMKRGQYKADKMDESWHEFDENGVAVKMTSYQNGTATYYEEYIDGEVFCNNPNSPLMPKKINNPTDDTHAAKLCEKYDSEHSYQSLHLQVSQGR